MTEKSGRLPERYFPGKVIKNSDKNLSELNQGSN